MKIAIVQVNEGKVTVHFLANNQSLPMDDALHADEFLTALGYVRQGSATILPGSNKVFVYYK